MSVASETAVSTQTYRTWIEAEPAAIWEAITTRQPRYGYPSPVEIDLQPGGTYSVLATPEMIAFGAPAVMIEGEILEVVENERLSLTWHALFDETTAAEPAGIVTWHLEPAKGGVTKITLVHDLEGAPVTAAIVGGVVVDAGGGWGWILSDLKTLLETGSALPVQMGGDC